MIYRENMEAAEVQAWLSCVYPTYPVRVSEVQIPSVERPPDRTRARVRAFEEAFRGRCSRQHAWLKWFALNWLAANGSYEVDVFIPPTLGKWGQRERGKVLPRGHRYRELPGWRFQRADIVCFDTLVEVGVTSASSLVEPLWSYAVREVLWLPFQSEQIDEDWLDFSFESKAFRLNRRGRSNNVLQGTLPDRAN